MKLEQSFEVSAPLDRVWSALIDVERVAPCLPGASITGRNDDGSYEGSFKVKIGPTSAAYTGKLQMENVDEGTHIATMQAAGTDKRGQGGAKATIVSSVSEAGADSTRVDVATDYHITGRLARFGRGGMIEEISNRLLREFAQSLQEMLAGEPQAAAAGSRASAGAGEGGAGAEGAAAEGAAAEGAAAVEDAAPLAADAVTAGNGAPPVDSTAPAEPEAVGTAEVLGTPEPPRDVPTGGAPSSALAAPIPPSQSPPPENDPVQGLSLVASAMWSQAKRNPLPLLSALIGFLLALRVFRRKG